MKRFSPFAFATLASGAFACAAGLALVTGCTQTAGPAPIVYGDAGAGNAQTPPTSGTDVEAWLRGGAYKKWHCEPAVHAARSPSPHGFDRVCANALVNPTAGAADGGPWPTGAAEVKELYTSATATTPAGYAVSLKTAPDDPADAGSAGSNWYWYERTTDGTREADGLGTPNTSANSICVACHAAAGSDTAHTTSAGSRDLVYTPVP